MFVLLELCFILFVVRRCWQGPWAKLQCVDENVLSSSLCPKHTALITSGQYSTVLFVFLKVIFWLLLFISELILQLLWLADI